MPPNSKNAGKVMLALTLLAVLGGGALVLARSAIIPETSEEKGPARPLENNKEKRSGMAPHKALYQIDLVSSHSGSQIIDISGQMFFKWEASCDAWITDHRFKLVYEYADSPAMRITSEFSAFEPFDGSSFNFTSRRERDGQMYQEIRGRADMDANGGEAVYNIPEGLTYQLPAGAMFPIAHTIDLIKAAGQGKKFHNAVIFDGSDEEGPVLVNSFIGKETNAVATLPLSPDIDGTLINTPAHRLRMAFFPVGSDEATADYEMNVIFHDNGVISDMVIEYEDFTVSQKLVALEKLESASCN